MKRLAIAALVSALVSPSAFADVVRLDGFQFSNSSSLSFKLTTPAKSMTTAAGEFRGTLNGQSFLSFCVDLLQSFAWGTSYSNYTTASQGSGVPAWYNAGKAADLGRLYTGFSALVTDAVTSAAFQLATWEIVTEAAGSAYDTDTGSFIGAAGHTSGTAMTNENRALDTADSWLQNLPGYSNYSIRIEYSSATQDLVTAKRVPEPTGMALAATALGLLALSRRRNAKARPTLSLA